jgi:hypothetical protein
LQVQVDVELVDEEGLRPGRQGQAQQQQPQQDSAHEG